MASRTSSRRDSATATFGRIPSAEAQLLLPRSTLLSAALPLTSVLPPSCSPPSLLLASTAPPAAAPPAAAPAAPQESAHAAEAARLLLPLLEQPPGALRSAAAVGVAKLLHAGRVVSSHLLSRLLLLYFEPPEMASEPEANAEQAWLHPHAPPPPPRAAAAAPTRRSTRHRPV